MSKKGQLTENLKIRTTFDQKMAIEQAAEREGLSVSDILRKAIFESSESIPPYVYQIRMNLIRNEMQNRITFLDIPKKTKGKIIKELSEIDICGIDKA